jgi:hypothetical protein
MLIPSFLVGSEGLDGFNVHVVESVDNLDLSDNTNSLSNFFLGLSSFSASLLHEFDEFLDLIILSLDLVEHTFGVLLVIIAFLAFVLELQLECFQFKAQFLVFGGIL